MGLLMSKTKVEQRSKRKKMKLPWKYRCDYLSGQHECQMSEAGEENLDKYFDQCTKKAGHSKFISFNKFSVENLPEGHRDKDLFALIKATGDLTVRIGVSLVSTNRPTFWPNTDSPYPFGNKKGNTNLRLGSGEIRAIKFINGIGYNGLGIKCNVNNNEFEDKCQTCPCEKCQNSEKPNNVWWEIFVHTATHVVFDDLEAKNAACRLFFNERDSPVVSINNFRIVYASIKEDKCMMKYVTCDSLGDELYKKVELCCLLWENLLDKHRSNIDVKFNFIVSHPHGRSKQVSVGQLMDCKKVGEYKRSEGIDWTKVTYTTSTCPGSSGAIVHFVGFRGYGHVHCGTIDSVINFSSIGLYRH